ncbi:hypothetical protein [Hymenobacter pini]|uniref:hypothetical protein n=1 Tax=Hymenobacter pini TaxID=2880879 RepID=UPI001CF4CE18|nr:hypothetical protein [Hymenobacter pini]MCA8832064.1 hypothetical protein [Hymenobacter pini]
MLANYKPVQGRFSVIDSFAIPRRNEFYLIGQIAEGMIQEGWYAHISLNASLALSMRIERIEYALMKAREEYPVLVIAADDEEVNLLLSLSIGSEPIMISTEGPE